MLANDSIDTIALRLDVYLSDSNKFAANLQCDISTSADLSCIRPAWDEISRPRESYFCHSKLSGQVYYVTN